MKKGKTIFKVILSLIVLTIMIIGCAKKQTETNNGRQQEKNEQPKTELDNEQIKDKTVQTNKVQLNTNMGAIVIELDTEKAPISTENFLEYTKSGAYNGTIFHRVINNFMIQGGGFTKDMQKKPTNAPIQNEASNGLSNVRGSIAMARTNDPHSATNQFFINHKDNKNLDYIPNMSPGYAVFGKVVEGMDVVDKIAEVKTTVFAPYRDVPAQPVIIESATVLE